MGRGSWMDLRGKKGKMIKVISTYRFSRATSSQADELTSYKKQVHSMLIKGIKNPNPKKVFLTDLSKVITSGENTGKSMRLY